LGARKKICSLQVLGDLPRLIHTVNPEPGQIVTISGKKQAGQISGDYATYDTHCGAQIKLDVGRLLDDPRQNGPDDPTHQRAPAAVGPLGEDTENKDGASAIRCCWIGGKAFFCSEL
jgi:hypothetical protein